MDITVTFQDERWFTDPSPAIVAVGTRVRWVLLAPKQRSRALLWKVHFGENLPFGEDHRTLEVETQYVDVRQQADIDQEILRRLNLPENAAVIHRGVTETNFAERPGDFKYDLSVQDAITGERIGDDDPWLIVIPIPSRFYAR
jgi:hypothetical protein